MTEEKTAVSPAEVAAQKALDRVFSCIRQRKNFRLEAGAGAGKTYSLVAALRSVVDSQGMDLSRRNQRVACITYTNVASDQITSQTDHHPVVHSSTIHSFCWSLMSGFQPSLRERLPGLDGWAERLEQIGGIGERRVEYDLGHPRAKPDEAIVSLGHNDVLTLAASLMDEKKFRRLFAARFPILFIDEYQDTNEAFAKSLLTHFIETGTGPLIGLFGDSWQKIYGDGCGLIDHENLTVIGKEANFRSVKAIVEVLNRMRPELPQQVKDPHAEGSVAVYHTNEWSGSRRTGSHWAGDLPAQNARDHLQAVQLQLQAEGWDLSPQTTRILMLTHGVLAAEQNYSGIAASFRYSEAFAKKESPHIAFLVDVVEPVRIAYEHGCYGEMLSVLGSRSLTIRSRDDKRKWSEVMDRLLGLCEAGTIGQVMDHVRDAGSPPLPEAVRATESRLSCASAEEISESWTLTEIDKLRSVPYQELVALAHFINEHTPFSTQHGMKGAESEEVLVVLGRGWNQYNWNRFLEWSFQGVPDGKSATYKRNRNLFYVACSRPKRRLALLFTQELSAAALSSLSQWFGETRVNPIVA